MRAVTITGTTLARVCILALYGLLVVISLALASGLAFAGYITFLAGADRLALFFWGMSCLPLVLLGVVGSLLPDWLRKARTSA